MSASRAVAAIASKRPRASAESLGDVSRAVSLWTAITDRWCATMSCSSRAIRARSSIAVCSRTLSAIASCVASSAATTSVRLRVDSASEHRRDDEQERPDARRARVAAVERCDGVNEKRQQERDREEEAAPDDELADRVQQDAERRQGDRRFGRCEQQQREERRAGRGEERESLRGDERQRPRARSRGPPASGRSAASNAKPSWSSGV